MALSQLWIFTYLFLFIKPSQSTYDDLVCPLPQNALQSGQAICHDLSTPNLVIPNETPPSGSTLASLLDNIPDATVTSDFMSFEQWKKHMLKRSAVESVDIVEEEKSTKMPLTHKFLEDTASDIPVHVDSGNVSITQLIRPSSYPSVSPNSNVSSNIDEFRLNYHPSKDAGKTCKERYSYSSFDAGATVLKTMPGAKNAKAILRENKDSYLLMECSNKNKFVIIELSDDILVDTIVVANFEFFSSMVRRFRVSASDRYPVKLDKWVDLGTFEAQNSRDIQAFLIQNPRIYARYIRLEFLSHYGNEYYCPISLVRVHGTTMIESWKEAEGTSDDTLALDEVHDLDEQVHTTLPNLSEHESIESSRYSTTPVTLDLTQTSRLMNTISASVSPTLVSAVDSATRFFVSGELKMNEFYCQLSCCNDLLPVRIFQPPTCFEKFAHNQACIGEALLHAPSHRPEKPCNNTDCTTPSFTILSASSLIATEFNHLATSSEGKIDRPSGQPNIRPSESNPVRSKTTSTSQTPLVQESFFKSISKRLQNLETNMTWSIKYLEDQAYACRYSMRQAEERHGRKSAALLKHLNYTILRELQDIKQDHDKLWQQTLQVLDGQREQSENELLALGARLNVLAEEVVFQKRMSIGQSVLLLSCLVLVIFSRSVIAQPLDWIHVDSTKTHLQTKRKNDKMVPNTRLEHYDTKVHRLPSRWPISSESSGDDETDPLVSHRLPQSPERSPGELVSCQIKQDTYVDGSPQNPLRRPASFVNDQPRKPLPALPEHPDM